MTANNNILQNIREVKAMHKNAFGSCGCILVYNTNCEKPKNEMKRDCEYTSRFIFFKQ